MFTKSEMTKKIASISKRNSTLRDDIQVVACNIAGHAYEHGDVTSATALLNATQGQDKVAIVRFLRDHCFVNVKSDGTVALNKKARSEADFVDGAACVEHLLANAPKWYEAAVSTSDAAKILDPVKRMEGLLKSIQKGDCELKACESREIMELAERIAGAIAAQREIAIVVDNVKAA